MLKYFYLLLVLLAKKHDDNKKCVTITKTVTSVPTSVPTTVQITSTTTTSVPTTTTTSLPTTTSIPTTSVPLPLSQQLSTHNKLTDCWVYYKLNVYDMTAWVLKHPGGQNVFASVCGTTNFVAALVDQHGNSKNTQFLAETTLIGVYV